MNTSCTIFLSFLTVLFTVCHSTEDLFPCLPPPALPISTSATAVSAETLTASSWNPAFDEALVRFHGLAWHPQEAEGFTVRLGRGGQIFSLRSLAGETIPPQIHQNSPWNDEVWQMVAVCTAKNDKPPKGSKEPSRAYFIHGSGIYQRDARRTEPFYNPILAFDSRPGQITIANWGQHAHVPTPHRSSVIYITRLAVLEGGVLEVTQVLYNFGEDELNHLNLPWGGIRSSLYPHKEMTGQEQGGAGRNTFGGKPAILKPLTETRGFAVFSRSEPTPHAMAWVYGRHAPTDRLRPVVRWGYAGDPNKPNARDYFVVENIVRTKVRRGEALLSRHFFLFGDPNSIEARAQALNMHGRLEFLSAPADAITDNPELSRQFGRQVKRGLVTGWQPLFRITLADRDQPLLTTDPYAGLPPDSDGPEPIYRPYDGRIVSWELVGFVE